VRSGARPSNISTAFGKKARSAARAALRQARTEVLAASPLKLAVPLPPRAASVTCTVATNLPLSCTWSYASSSLVGGRRSTSLTLSKSAALGLVATPAGFGPVEEIFEKPGWNSRMARCATSDGRNRGSRTPYVCL